MQEKREEASLNYLIQQLDNDLRAIKNGTMGKLRGYCAECNVAIKDPDTVTYANSSAYHSYCFNCAGCKMSLVDRQYVLFKNNHYCDACYVQANSEKCNVCEQMIEGPILRFLEKSYHPSCLLCHHCKARLSEGHGILSASNDIYCPKCYEMAHTIICSICNQEIRVATLDTEFYSLNDKKYHSSCFKCSVCDCPLHTSKAFHLGSRLVCQTHFQNSLKKA